MDNQILAKVGDNEITRQELMNTIMSLPKDQINQFSQPEARKQLLNELIARELLFLDAKEKNMSEEEAFKKQVEEAKDYLLKQYAVQKLVGGIKLEDDEVRKYYDEHRGQFVKGPQVRAKHILVKEEEEARAILNQIKNGEKEFEDAAKEYSTCPSKERGGDLGFFGPKQMVPEFDKVVFAMEVGDLSHIVKTQFGYHIIKVEEKKDQEIQSFDQVQEQIKQFLLKQKQNQKYTSYTMELKEKYPVTVNEDALK